MDILEQTLETSQDEIQLKGEEIDDPKALVDGPGLTIIEDDGSLSDEQTVDNLAHAQAILDAEDNVHYQFRGGEGVTYRVVQVNPEDNEHDGLSPVVNDNYNSTQGSGAVLSSGVNSNHFYVIGANDVFNTPPRSLAQRSNMALDRNIVLPNSTTRVRRDDRRRATHNEVERRRRDKINNWILKLSKIIPDCNTVDSSKGLQSKGGILARACEYIMELRTSNQRLGDCLKENERLNSHIDYLQQQNDKLKVDNAMLKSVLTQNSIQPPGEVSSQSTRNTSVLSDS